MRNLLHLCAVLLASGMALAGEATIRPGVPQQAAQNNPGVAAELGLSAAEEATLFDIIDRHQSAQRELSNRIAESRDTVVLKDLIQQQVPLQREREDAITSLLGPARYVRWQDYERTRPQRLQAASIASTLARSGRPLNQEQQQAVLRALIDSQTLHQRQLATSLPANAINLADAAAPDFSARLRELSVKSLEDSRRRILEAVAPHLDTRQLETLRSQL
jgi:hypothetical protein